MLSPWAYKGIATGMFHACRTLWPRRNRRQAHNPISGNLPYPKEKNRRRSQLAWCDPSPDSSLAGGSSVVFRVILPMEPTHLGALLRIYVLPALNLSVGQAARDQQITRQTLHRILAGAAARTPENGGANACGRRSAACFQTSDLSGQISCFPHSLNLSGTSE
jgi:hypothetical protein